jgi:hypothetical protein
MTEILNTYTFRLADGKFNFFSTFLIFIYICLIIFIVYVAIRVLIACNIYIKNNKQKTKDKENP